MSSVGAGIGKPVSADDIQQTPFRAAWALVLLLIAAAAGLRLWELGRHPLWVDELYSMETSAGHGFAAHWNLPRGFIGPAPDLIGLGAASPWWTIPTVMGNDTHPPVYFMLLRAWRELFGDTESAARGFAVLAGVAAIPLLFLLGRDLFGTTTALWACAIYAVAGPQIQLAQEVRGYTLLVALTLAAALILVRVERRGSSRMRLALLALCVAAMLLTHYFTLGPVAGLVVYVIIRFRNRLRWTTLGAVLAGGVLFAVGWGPMMLHQLQNLGDTNDWVLESREGNLGRTLLRAALLPARYLNEPMQTSAALAAVAGLLYVVPLLLLRRRPGMLLPLLMLVTTVGFVAALDVARAAYQLEFVRYTLAAAPFVYLILAGVGGVGGDAGARRIVPHLLPAVVIASCLVSLPRAYAYPIPTKPDWPWLTAQMTRDGSVDTLILLGPGPHTWITANYLGLYYYMHPKPANVMVLSNPADLSEQTAARLRATTGAVWAFSLPGRTPVLPPGFEAERVITETSVGIASKLRPVK